MTADVHLELLGKKMKDVVTGFTGVVISVSFDLYGCIQACMSPPLGKDGVVKDCYWFDVTRLIVVDKKPVMEVPNFEAGYTAEGRKGCAVKPMNRLI